MALWVCDRNSKSWRTCTQKASWLASWSMVHWHLLTTLCLYWWLLHETQSIPLVVHFITASSSQQRVLVERLSDSCLFVLFSISTDQHQTHNRPLTLIMVINHPYLLSPSTTIHGILPIQSTCFTVFFHNLLDQHQNEKNCELIVMKMYSPHDSLF